MSPELARFCRALAGGGSTATPADWRERLGSDWEQRLDVFRDARRPVESVPCRTPCVHGCRRQVQINENGAAWAFCPEPDALEDAYPLAPEELREKEWVPERVADKAASALARYDGNVRGQAEATRFGPVWRIARVPVPAWLLLEPGSCFWPALLARMLAEIPGPGRLFLPTACMIEPERKRLFEQKGWAVVFLDECLEMDAAGKWRFMDRLPDVTVPSATGACASVSAQPVDSDPYAFRRMGASWLMVYDGTAFHINHTQGCPVLAVLLENPRRSFTHLALKRIVDGKAEPRTRQNPIEVVDREARIDLDASIDQLQSFIDPEGDPAEQAEQREQLENLLKQRNAARGLGGKTRIVRDDGEKARQSVGKNLVTVLRAIGAANTDAGRHFAAFSPMAHELTYSPPEDVSWVVERK